MVDTNALLSIAFSMLANFSNIVEVPHQAVPMGVDDLEKCVLGSPNSPVDVTMVHKKGTRFFISRGSVCDFCTPGSFRELQDPKQLPKFLGEPTLDSNAVLRLATTTLQRLVKTGDPFTNGPPKLTIPHLSDGQSLPFYYISWPTKSKRQSLRYAAFMEIDARKGLITSMHLVDDEFYDYAFAQQISNRVYTPDPPRKRPELLPRSGPYAALYPCPTTNQAAQAITGWLWFCSRIGLAPGSQTNLDSVNWDKSFMYTNEDISKLMPICHIRFKNDVCFEAINGIAYNHFGEGAKLLGRWWDRPRDEIEAMNGKIEKDWTELAKQLEATIETRLGIPTNLVARFTPWVGGPKPVVGTVGPKPIRVEWRTWPGRDPTAVNETPRAAFGAEFDLQTGELNCIVFADPQFVGAIRREREK